MQIWEQTKGKVDAWTVSTGTGGTYAGVAAYLKSKNKNVQCVLADPPGSVLASYFKTGKMERAGNNFGIKIGSPDSPRRIINHWRYWPRSCHCQSSRRTYWRCAVNTRRRYDKNGVSIAARRRIFCRSQQRFERRSCRRSSEKARYCNSITTII